LFDSIVFGLDAGQNVTNVYNSIFLGTQAGENATNAASSNFIGIGAGQGATNAASSNFFGEYAGAGATDAGSSNFIGFGAGVGATNASASNFIGEDAGSNATTAAYSNFLGFRAGRDASTASYSNLFGYNAGKTFSTILGTNNIGANNIIIGKNISLPNATENGINIGGVLFGSGTYSTDSTNPSITGQTNGRIGINVVNPTQSLHVSGNTLINGNLTANTLNINYIPASAITTNNVLMRASNGDIQSIAIADLATLIQSNMELEKELIIKVQHTIGGSTTYTIEKDDLSVGAGITFGMTYESGNWSHYRFDIIFASITTDKVIFKNGNLPYNFNDSLAPLGRFGSSSSFAYYVAQKSNTYNSSTTTKVFRALVETTYSNGTVLNFTFVFRVLP
jgi:hypothetical protein